MPSWRKSGDAWVAHLSDWVEVQLISKVNQSDVLVRTKDGQQYTIAYQYYKSRARQLLKKHYA